MLSGCVPVDPDSSVVPRACMSVWWWRAQFFVRGNRGLLPVSTSVRILFLSALPGTHTDQFELSRPGGLAEGEVCDGGRAPAVRGYRRLEAGREGLRPGPGWARAEDVVDSDDVGGDDQPDPGPEGLPGRATGHRGGDGIDVGLLAAVLLRAGGRLRGAAGQRARREERPGPENRCFRRCLAGRPGR